MSASVNRVIGRMYVIGCRVYCAERSVGYLTSAVVNPENSRLEHLIVTPDYGADSRLVPAATAQCGGAAIRLNCSYDEFAAMELAVDVHLTPTTPADPEEPPRYHHEEIAAWPFFDLGPSTPSLGLAAPEPVLMPRMSYDDHVPAGKARIYPGDHVHATDGAVGHVCGVIVAPAGDAVTHILLTKGHLHGHKRVAIPMDLVGAVGDEGVSVFLTKHEIKDLPPVEVVDNG